MTSRSHLQPPRNPSHSHSGFGTKLPRHAHSEWITLAADQQLPLRPAVSLHFSLYKGFGIGLSRFVKFWHIMPVALLLIHFGQQFAAKFLTPQAPAAPQHLK